MSGTGSSPEPWIAVVGDRIEGFGPQDAIASAIDHAARHLGGVAPPVRWIATAALAETGTGLLTGAIAVWCAPGGPYQSPEGAFDGIRWAREGRVPFLGTCAGFQHAVIEFARNVLGHQAAAHAEYETPADPSDLFIDELACSVAGQTMALRIVDDDVLAIYGQASPSEEYYCRFGVNPRWRDALHEAGLRAAGVDLADGDVRILRLAGHPFFLLTLFVPQTLSTPASPHPLVTAYVRAALERHAARRTATATG